MKPFQSQIRLNKWNVDEVQRRLAELLRLEDRLHEDMRALQAELLAEQAAATASVEASFTYGAYVAQLIERRQKLNRSIAEVGTQVIQAREDLKDAFTELKKFELAAEAAQDRAKRRRDQQERVQLDEVALGIYRRRAD